MNLWAELGEEPSPLVRLFDPLPPVRIEGNNTALLVVDMDNASTTEDGALIRLAEAAGISTDYYRRRLSSVIPNIEKLVAAFRRAGLEVVYTKGRGSKGGHKLGGYQVRPLRASSDLASSRGAREIHPALAPLSTDLVLEKDTPGPFGVTNIDHALRNLGISRLVVTGVVTDQCVEGTVRGAFDFGYEVVLVEDACATFTEQLHLASLRILADWFCRLATTDEIVKLARPLERMVNQRG